MKSVFMVAEKPSLAQSLAEILSDRRCNSRKAGNGACSVHEWAGNFRGEHVKFKMTSVCGHVMSLDFPGKYNNWDKVDPVELFHCPTEKKEATPKLRMPDTLSREAKNCDYVVLWLDCDREGENICFEVIDAIRYSLNKSYGDSQTFFRAKFSAITDKEIKGAMNSLVSPDKNEALAVDARQELDLRIGCAFTRYQTKFFQGKYGDLDSNVISFGPCQTPTLGFCVERHDFIQSFKPETYWVLKVRGVTIDDKVINLDWERGRVFEKDVANLYLDFIKHARTAKIVDISEKEKVKKRPPALNTVELMRAASSGLGIGSHQAMSIAERLYIQGYISYPRTETTRYPDSFDLRGTLKHQEGSNDWGDEVKSVLQTGINFPKHGKDCGDHPPITPMKQASRNQMDHDSWSIYEYIVRHFLGTLMPDCRYLTTTYYIQIGKESFSVTGKKLIDPGFTKAMTWQKIGDDENLPNISVGDEIVISESRLDEKQTSPPSHLTESELISLMEKHGIGTDASIPVHINNICQRNYVQVGSGRRMVPTSLGIVLVHGYKKIDIDLVLPTMRSGVEEQLTLIAKGKADFESVLSHTLEIFHLKFKYFVNNVCMMDELFEVSFSPLSATGKPLSRCGKCRRYLKLVESKPIRLFCPACDETFKLPSGGLLREFQDHKCPLDDFQLLSWSAGPKGKSYTFCPYCYNHPPFSGMFRNSGCSSCLHPTCSFSREQSGVSVCMECSDGILVLNHSSGPKWKLDCNRCDVIINVFDKASKVTVLSENCEECRSQIVTVEYKEGKSKLVGELLSETGCIFCSPVLSLLVEKLHANNKPKRRFEGGDRGKRRGRFRGRR